jgi:hypothetical protein
MRAPFGSNTHQANKNAAHIRRLSWRLSLQIISATSSLAAQTTVRLRVGW